MSRIDLVYKEPSSLIMSGVESDSYWDIAASAGIDKMLISYHYVQKKGRKFIASRMEQYPNIKLMIDSGAYTFHTNEEEYRKKPMEYWTKYLDGYTKFIRDNHEHIFSCVNLDIANLVGQEQVDAWDDEYFKPLEELGVLVCRVWHTFDGKPMWEEMCRKYRYVGFSLAMWDASEAELMKMFNIAKRYNTLVHGFAVTRVDLMSRVPFYTGDSTTWLVGTKYGELNWFDGRTMKRLKKDKWKRQYKTKFIKLGGIPKLMDEESPYELIRINLLVFKKAEEFIRKRIRAKEYWRKGAPITKTKEETRPMPLFKKTSSAPAAAPAAAAPKKRLSLKKGAQKREDLEAQGKSKLDEFMEVHAAAAAAIKPKPKKLKLKKSRPQTEQSWNIPSKEWFSGEMEDWEEYVLNMNISPSYPRQDALDLLWEFYVYLTPDEEEMAKNTDEAMIETAKFYTEQDAEDREDAIRIIREFFTSCISGENDFFNRSDELDEEAPERPKERDSYLEDEHYEKVDVTPEDLGSIGFLPPGSDASMEEVEAYDEELRETNGIIAIRDENGRFVKGQKVVRKPKQIYSKHFPKLACNTCYKAGECPEYKPDHACAFDKIFNQFDTRNTDDLVDAMSGMANMNLGRMMRLAMFEQMDGGMPDPALTAMIDQNMKLMNTMKQLIDSKGPGMIAQQTHRINADGTQETTTMVTNPTGGGILERIFGNKNAGIMDIPEEEDEYAAKRKDAIDIN